MSDGILNGLVTVSLKLTHLLETRLGYCSTHIHGISIQKLRKYICHNILFDYDAYMSDDKTTSVQSIMTPLPLETANPLTNLRDIANQMKEKNKGAIIIVEQQTKDTGITITKPIGIITERDIVRRVLWAYESINPKEIMVSAIMTKPLITIGDEASIYDAALIMTKYSIRRLPVTRDNVLLGIVTTTDMTRRIYEKNKEDPVLKVMSRFGQLEQKQEK
jgi:CBS domain-containing protein